MIVDLSEHQGSILPFDYTIGQDEIDLDLEEVHLTREIRVKGEVTPHIAQTDVNGRIETAADVDCTRCLKPVPVNLAIDFDVAYVTPEHFASAREKEVGADDLKTDVLESTQLDLNEVVREQILLNLPEQVFCKEDCKGLCPKCGADRNLIDCKCEETEIDPRWAALKDLK